ncbi:MAG: Trm112 family protein [Verrucomicrobiota bacterium]
MSLDPELLDLLRCPQTGQRLAPAPADQLSRLEARRREGTLRLFASQPQWDPGQPLEAVLVREDGQVGYPVQAGIPILLPDHGIRLHSPRV